MSTSGWKLGVVGVVVVAVVGGGYYKLKKNDERIDAQPTVAVASPRPGCQTVVVDAAPALEAPLISASNAYNSSDRKVAGRCYGIRIQTATSPNVEAQLTSTWDTSKSLQPQIWIPESTEWLTHLASQTQANGNPLSVKVASSEPLVTSVLTIAMPQPMAQALGWPNTAIGWSDLHALAADPAGWGSHGHPEWGKFVLAKPNPTLSMTGLDATVSAFLTASAAPTTGPSSTLDPAQISDANVQSFASALERSVLNYSDDPQLYLTNLRQHDDAGKPLTYASAIVTTEQSVVAYDAGVTSPPKTPLVALYPKEGTFVSDYPFTVLDAAWSMPNLRNAAKDFLDFLKEPGQQANLSKAGFRGASGAFGAETAASPAAANGDIRADGNNHVLTAPTADTIKTVRDAWRTLRKPARVTLLLDISASMGDLAENTETTKLQVAQSAAVNALGELAPTDEVGLTAFSLGLDSPSKRYRELVPIGVLSVDKSQIMTQLSTVVPQDAATLYAAVTSVSRGMSTDAEDDHINAAVIVSGSKDSDPDKPSLDQLVEKLATTQPQVQLFTIGFGKDADMPALQALSSATNGTAYDATDTSTAEAFIRAAFASL